MPTLDDLFLTHLGPSLAKHLSLLRATDGLDAEIDLDAGEVTFGERLTFPVQWLGSEDEASERWTWGWAQRPALPKALTEVALALKAQGQREGLDLFTAPSFDLGDLTGDTLALLGCGLSDSDAFFLADTDAGSTCFLIPDLKGRIPRETSVSFVAEVISEMLDTYELQEPGKALRAYLAYEGYAISETSPREWVARHPAGRRIDLSFDAQGRLATLRASGD